MEIRFYIDPLTDQPHIYNHNVAESEVEEVLEYPGEDRAGKEGSRVALGPTLAGRYLKIIYVPDEQPGSIFVITAYDLVGKSLLAFKRRRRKRT